MRKDETLLFVSSLVGLAVSAAVVILLVPTLFRSAEPGRVWAAAISGCLAVAFAVGTRRWRPSGQHPDGS